MPTRLIQLFGLMLVPILAACDRPKSQVVKTMEIVDSWSAAFSNQYPDPIAPFTKSPELGRTGNVGATKDLEFLLLDFPEDRLPEIETFVRSKLKADSIDSATITTFVPAKLPVPPEAKEIVTLRYYSDGRIEDSRASGKPATLPKLNLNGQPIQRSEQDSGGKRD